MKREALTNRLTKQEKVFLGTWISIHEVLTCEKYICSYWRGWLRGMDRKGITHFTVSEVLLRKDTWGSDIRDAMRFLVSYLAWEKGIQEYQGLSDNMDAIESFIGSILDKAWSGLQLNN